MFSIPWSSIGLFRNQNSGSAGRPFLRLVLAVTGASGSVYAVRLLEHLRQRPDLETHLILSRAAERTLYLETSLRAADLKALAAFTWPVEDISAPVASGSFLTDAMLVVPCSVNTMSSIAHGISSNLIVRAADVVLKEKRKLILGIRETPLHLGHLRTMVQLAEMGAVVAPPIPAFYGKPSKVEDLVDASIDRWLDLAGLPRANAARWNGPLA